MTAVEVSPPFRVRARLSAPASIRCRGPQGDFATVADAAAYQRVAAARVREQFVDEFNVVRFVNERRAFAQQCKGAHITRIEAELTLRHFHAEYEPLQPRRIEPATSVPIAARPASASAENLQRPRMWRRQFSAIGQVGR